MRFNLQAGSQGDRAFLLRKLVSETRSLSSLFVELKKKKIGFSKPRKKTLTFKFFPVNFDHPLKVFSPQSISISSEKKTLSSLLEA